MCYAQPGPRCSNHATKKLDRAKTALLADPNDLGLMKNLKTAQEEYDTTPVGIKELRAEGKDYLADIAQQTRAAQLALTKEAKAVPNPIPDDLDDREELDSSSNDLAVLTLIARSLEPTADDYDLAETLAKNPNTPTEALELVYDYTTTGHDDEGYLREKLLSNPNTSPRLLAAYAEEILEGEITEFGEAVASNPSTPPASLAVCVTDCLTAVDDIDEDEGFDLSNIGAENILRNLIANPNTPAHSLAPVVTNENVDEDIRAQAADRLTPEVLVEVLKADYPEVSTDMPREWLMGLLKTQ